MNPTEIFRARVGRFPNRSSVRLVWFAIAWSLLVDDALASYKFCAWITPVYSDSMAGVEFPASSTPARRHYMKLTRGTATVWEGVADDQGCAPGTHTQAGTYKLQVWPKLGLKNSSGVVTSTISVYRSSLGSMPNVTATWSNLGSQTSIPWYEKRMTIAGTSFDSVWRVTAAINHSPIRVDGTTYSVLAEADPAICVACAAGDVIYLSQSAPTSKSVILHEYGHVIQNRIFGWFGMDGLTDLDAEKYCASPQNQTCGCSMVATSPNSSYCGSTQWDRLHCLNSKEYMFAAFNEGFAHALATHGLNGSGETNPTFGYYKNLISRNGSTFTPAPFAHAVLPSSPYRWMETQCSSSMTQRGTEMDWLSFLTSLLTQTPNKYQYADLQRILLSDEVCDGYCTTDTNVTWAMMEDGVDAQTGWSADKRSRFSMDGDRYGVDH